DRRSWEDTRRIIEQASADGAWLVFFGHEVAPEGRQAVIPRTLEKVCEYCAMPENEIWIDTVAAVGEYVRTTRGGKPS
ncbi:MAG TPA: polysaccharide deacetylase, partial [Planctomycetota bacterium]|nr:polysaccharide deacetylase [Planctomycetota bacterium]